MKVALSIAGSDSSGGAGIQTDVKAMASIGVHPCTVVTCVTAQNTERVDSIYPLPTTEIEKQLESVLADITIDAAKTGMLYSAQIVETVAKVFEGRSFPVVVDPVMIATTQGSLETGDLTQALISRLLPLCELVTPNIMEAESLSGLKIKSEDEAKSACEKIHSLGAKNVLVKGGHLGDKPVDILLSEGEFRKFSAERYPEDVHGSGCAFSAFIAGGLTLGMELEECIRESKKMVTAGFFGSRKIGKGFPVIQSHYSADRYPVWKELDIALEELKEFLPADLVPEVGMNIGYAVPFATDPSEVAALKGRIIRVGEGIDTPAHIDFGTSVHISRIILTVLRFDHRYRSAMNVRFSEEIVDRFKHKGLVVSEFDRSEEPGGVSTMEWGTERAISNLGKVPDVVFDRGSVGKEPMVRILGRSPLELLEKLKLVLNE
ncbi:MAG: bifunctional hydroxymethylpyrimidine kinase/phosphomethylpyrimidine kinase [Methanobacteriota archaeon]|nr:MAG: bifunctional hydroxymethylpyrimidine kinase/phosphomethylpyrimidine kinase [Euryarchaeota archaeon]